MRKGGEEKEIVGIPNGDEDFILRRFGERARVDISGYITRFDGLEIDESLFRIDPAHVHLAGVAAEQRVIAPVPAGGRRSLRPTPIRLLRWGTGDDSQTSNLFRPRSRLGRYGRLVSFCGGG